VVSGKREKERIVSKKAGSESTGCLPTKVGGFVDSAKRNGDKPMVAFKPIRRLFLYAATALCLVGSAVVPTGARGQERNPDEEVQTGQEVFNELKVKGEICTFS